MKNRIGERFSPLSAARQVRVTKLLIYARACVHKKQVPTYAKGYYPATEKIVVHYPSAVENSRQTVKALLPEGLPGIEDTDIRNQWLTTQCKTFSNVYDAIEFLQNLRD